MWEASLTAPKERVFVDWTPSSRRMLRLAMVGLVALIGGFLLVSKFRHDGSSSETLVATLIEARGAAATGELGREFFLGRLEDPLHSLEGRLSATDEAAGGRLRRAISSVESAIDGHVSTDAAGNVEVVEQLTGEVCRAFQRLGESVPADCS